MFFARLRFACLPGSPFEDLGFLVSFVRNNNRFMARGTFNEANLKQNPGHISWLHALGSVDKPELHRVGDLMLEVLEIDTHLSSLPKGCRPFGEQVTHDIVVRPFFERLFEALLDRPHGRLRKFALVGNPGIGKSWLHGYILWKLLEDKRDSVNRSWSTFQTATSTNNCSRRTKSGGALISSAASHVTCCHTIRRGFIVISASKNMRSNVSNFRY